MKMNPVTVKPSSILYHSSSTVLRNSYRPNSHVPWVKFPGRDVRNKGKLSLRVKSHDSSKEDDFSKSNGDSELPGGTLAKSREEILLDYVNNLRPDFIKSFLESEPQEVVDEIPKTLTNLIKTLPSQYIDGGDSAVGKILAQLMYTVTIIGFMFWSSVSKKELNLALGALVIQENNIQLEDPPDDDEPLGKPFMIETEMFKKDYAQIMKWINNSESDPKKCVHLLEAEFKELNRQVRAKTADEQKELFEHIESLIPQLEELVYDDESIREDVSKFISYFPAFSDIREIKNREKRFSSKPLFVVLRWLMMAGYYIREKKIDFEIKVLMDSAKKDGRLNAEPTDEN